MMQPQQRHSQNRPVLPQHEHVNRQLGCPVDLLGGANDRFAITVEGGGHAASFSGSRMMVATDADGL